MMLLFKDRFDTLSFAACSAPLTGLIMEFGVATGATIGYLASCVALQGRTIFGFDSFKGLPEKWADYDVGYFACDPPDVPSNVELIIGLFIDTLPAFLATHADKCALIHFDADLFSSTWQALDFLNDRIIPGTVIALDEYWIEQDQERRAFDNWMVSHQRECRLVARSLEQAVFEVDK